MKPRIYRCHPLNMHLERATIVVVHLKFSEPRNVEYNEVFLLICDVHEF